MTKATIHGDCPDFRGEARENGTVPFGPPNDPGQALCGQIEAFFGGGRCFLLTKGRVGLYVGLRALGLPPGAKVLMPGYTCVVVPAAVQHAGLRPVYVDIDADTYNLDPKRLEGVAGDGLAALIVQHTYGIPAPMEAIGAWAASRSLPVIEDCCHTFGARVGGRRCGTLGSFAFMSGQWNKFFSTGLGGMLLVNDDAVAQRAAEILRKELIVPGVVKDLRLWAQILAFRLLMRPGTAALLTGLYRRLNRVGLTVGSLAGGSDRRDAEALLDRHGAGPDSARAPRNGAP